MKRSALLGAVPLATTALAHSAHPQTPSGEPRSGKLNWLPLSDAVFSQAKHERRFVLLDVEAVWGLYQYPSVPPTAAYVCTERTCSVPIFKAEALAGEVNQVLGLVSMNA